MNLFVFAVNYLLFDGKMRAIFSMLFGAGVILFSERNGRVYFRRIFWLLIIGLRKVPARWLMVAGLAVFLLSMPEAKAIEGGMFVHQLFPDGLGMMLVGMGLYKTGFLTGKRSARGYAFIAIAGYSAGLSLIAWTLSLKVLTGFHSGPMLLGEYVMDWLRHFLFGPVERAWRCLTYWERLPLRRAL